MAQLFKVLDASKMIPLPQGGFPPSTGQGTLTDPPLLRSYVQHFITKHKLSELEASSEDIEGHINKTHISATEGCEMNNANNTTTTTTNNNDNTTTNIDDNDDNNNNNNKTNNYDNDNDNDNDNDDANDNDDDNNNDHNSNIDDNDT